MSRNVNNVHPPISFINRIAPIFITGRSNFRYFNSKKGI